MLCFEVYRNGERVCTAGVGDYGVMSAITTWVAHHPETLKRRLSEGVPETEAVSLDLNIGGLNHSESLMWADVPLAVGDEILIRIVENDKVDVPQRSKSVS